MELVKTITENKKDIINAMNSSRTMKRNCDKEIVITGIIIYKDGEKTVSVIKTSENEFISSISNSVRDNLMNICSLFSDEEILQGIGAIIRKKESRKSEREYLTIDLL